MFELCELLHEGLIFKQAYNFINDMGFEHYVCHCPGRNLPLNYADALGAMGWQQTTLRIIAHDEAHVSIMVHDPDPGLRPYLKPSGHMSYNLSRDLNTDNAVISIPPWPYDVRDKPTHPATFLQERYYNRAMAVVVEGVVKEDSPIGGWLRSLRGLPCLHFG